MRSSALLRRLFLPACVIAGLLPGTLCARGPKVHTAAVGKPQAVVWTDPADPATRLTMKVRPLVVDGKRKAWVTGDVHDITDHSFVALEVQHLNDALPGEKATHFIWKPTGWLLTERGTGHVSELKLAGYDPEISGLAWFRDYAGYCSVTGSGAKGPRLDAVVLELGTRKPLARRRLSAWPLPQNPAPPAAETVPPPSGPPAPAEAPAAKKGKTTAPAEDASPKPQVCGQIDWQREPVQASFRLQPGDAPVVLAPGPAPATEAGEPEQ